MHFILESALRKDYQEALKRWLKGAEIGRATDQFNVALLYFEGLGVPRDYSKAFFWISKSAGQGDTSAQELLAQMLSEGKGTKKNVQEGIAWLEKAANQGRVSSQRILSGLYAGRTVWDFPVFKDDAWIDYKKAYFWSRKASESGNSDAQFEFGVSCKMELEKLCNENESSSSINKAIAQWEKSAAEGNVGAMERLGQLYYLGYKVVKENEPLAFEWFERAANAGSLSAQFRIALWYCHSPSFEVKAKGRNWLIQSAKSGWVDSQLLLAESYLKGELSVLGQCVEKDVQKAIYWYQEAALKNSDAAMLELGGIFEEGPDGISADYVRAAYWYKQASELGSDSGKIALGKMYKEGKGVAKDLKKAADLFKEAKKLGNPVAELELEEMRWE